MPSSTKSRDEVPDSPFAKGSSDLIQYEAADSHERQ
jgi:hypothetical protein